jgi:hypothetical protein
MSSHPEIMPDFLTLEIVKSPSYSDPFSCYFHPLQKEKSQIRNGVDRWLRKKNPTLASLAKERQAQTAARHQIKNLSDGSMQTLEPFDPLGYSKTAKRQENYLLEAKAALGDTPPATLRGVYLRQPSTPRFNPDSAVEQKS